MIDDNFKDELKAESAALKRDIVKVLQKHEARGIVAFSAAAELFYHTLDLMVETSPAPEQRRFTRQLGLDTLTELKKRIKKL